MANYDVISNPGLESSMADLNLVLRPPTEPQPTLEAQAKWMTTRLEADDIQTWTQTTLGGEKLDPRNEQRTRRVYVDGVFDIFGVG